MTPPGVVSLSSVASFSSSEPSWRDLLTLVPVPAYTCDPMGRITYFNSPAEAVWGRAAKLRNSAERYCGSHRLYSMEGHPMPHDECWMALALLMDKPFHGHGVLIEREDGSRSSGIVYANPLHDSQHRLIGAVTLVAPNTLPKNRARDHEDTSLATVPSDAALAMIEVLLGLLTGIAWPTSAFA